MRRVVTEDVDGRSRFASDSPIPRSEFWDELWTATPADPLGREPSGTDAALEPPAGAVRWRVFSVPTQARMHELVGSSQEDEEAVYFHKTNTLDYIYVLDGDITLVMEEGDPLLLHAGDCVVQRATNHAWRNDGDGPVRLLGVMVALP